ncbi:MAG: glycerate kinase [Clostridia bacterium]|nr:glycerate kinase [Clostridia bacterium]
MKKILIAPDSFKGTLSAREAAEMIAKAARDASPGFEPVLMPIADGGEGTVDAFGAERREVIVMGPNGRMTRSFYGVLGDTAVIEMAAAAGLPLADPLDAAGTTTYGVGELIKSALDAGFRKFIIGLGGSATNDCGCGMAAACGVKFYNAAGKDLTPRGKTLADVVRIDLSGRDPRIAESEFTAMCDITNPLYGDTGAAYVFAPQKGADAECVAKLDAGLRSIAGVIARDCGTDVAQMPGAGAAGGCGAAIPAFFGGSLKRGIDVVLDVNGFDAALEGAALVVTGEGRFDSQTAGGKAISGIAARTKKKGIPLIVFCGAAEEDESAYDMGVTSVFSIQRKALPFKEAAPLNGPYLYRTALNVFRLLV